jgi:hypothetical protein
VLLVRDFLSLKFSEKSEFQEEKKKLNIPNISTKIEITLK